MATKKKNTKKSGRKTTKAPKPRTKRGRGPSRQHGSASEFVREQPIDMPTKEVVAKAAKLGLDFSQGLVRVIRFHMRHGRDGESAAVGRGAVQRGRPPRSVRPAAARTVTARSTAEAQLRRLVVELGTARARGLVVEVERAIDSYLTDRTSTHRGR